MALRDWLTITTIREPSPANSQAIQATVENAGVNLLKQAAKGLAVDVEELINHHQNDLYSMGAGEVDKAEINQLARTYADRYPQPANRDSDYDKEMVKCTECSQIKCPNRTIATRNVQTSARLRRCISYTAKIYNLSDWR
jgi:hypothetical protein